MGRSRRVQSCEQHLHVEVARRGTSPRVLATGSGEEAPPTAILESGIDQGVLTLIARQEIEYLAPVPYQRRPLEVQMWFGRLGGSSVNVCYEVHNDPASNERVLYARSTAVIVLVDAATGRPIRLSDEMRHAWEPYTGAPLVYAHR